MGTGSSPRVWGTEWKLARGVDKDRFIPTGVGNSTCATAAHPGWSVHPHGCGEQPRTTSSILYIHGSSPRVWGTGHCLYLRVRISRFIPTGVGNSGLVIFLSFLTPVHPHGCGEQHQLCRCSSLRSGSSPRVWGTDIHTGDEGKAKRFIPTGVGNRSSYPAPARAAPVHPHGCGEQVSFISISRIKDGSSPRVWGTGRPDNCLTEFIRFIPTGVGNSKNRSAKIAVSTVHPHGCGEQSVALMSNLTLSGSSPRVWGTDFF